LDGGDGTLAAVVVVVGPVVVAVEAVVVAVVVGTGVVVVGLGCAPLVRARVVVVCLVSGTVDKVGVVDDRADDVGGGVVATFDRAPAVVVVVGDTVVLGPGSAVT
jgi:hypothetical protein